MSNLSLDEGSQSSPGLRRFFAPLAIFFVLSIGTQLWTWAARAQDSRLVFENAFEYTVVHLDQETYPKTPQYQEALKECEGRSREAVPLFIERVLNAMATKGWRLTHVERRDNSSTFYYFERPGRKR